MFNPSHTSPLVLSDLVFYKMWKPVLSHFKLELRCCWCSAMTHAHVSHSQQGAAVDSPQTPQAFWKIQQHRRKHTSDTAAPLSLTFTSRWPLTIKTTHWHNDHRTTESRCNAGITSHSVAGSSAALLLAAFAKGEVENAAGRLPGSFTSLEAHFERPLLAVRGAAGQQVGCGGSRGGAAPDVQRLPLRAGRKPPAQVAGAGAGRGRQGPLAAVQAAGVVVCWSLARVARRADVRGAVVVGPPAGALALVTLAFQNANEGQLELAVVAGIDDGVEAAVEVAQPKDDFEEHLRRPQVHVERAWK